MLLPLAPLLDNSTGTLHIHLRSQSCSKTSVSSSERFKGTAQVQHHHMRWTWVRWWCCRWGAWFSMVIEFSIARVGRTPSDPGPSHHGKTRVVKLERQRHVPIHVSMTRITRRVDGRGGGGSARRRRCMWDVDGMPASSTMMLDASLMTCWKIVHQTRFTLPSKPFG